jgi:RNA polymerase subunit RPABC4/transcription elongation factor Spt4
MFGLKKKKKGRHRKEKGRHRMETQVRGRHKKRRSTYIDSKQVKICPTCDGFIPNNEMPGAYPGALSRRDNKTEICSSCGTQEAMEDFLAMSDYHIKAGK